MFNNDKTAKAVRIALAFGAASTAVFTSGAAFAAEEEVTAKVERIEVTGSRIKRADMEGANPVTVLDKVDIERFGLTSIGDVLQNLPAAGSAINTNSNNGGDGTTTLNIRGLGSNRTLVLVDGKRWAPGLGGSVDLNNIPSSIIERIEVLKDGASAVYGSDAVAGVVNIITKKDFEGVQANLYGGENVSHSDGRKEAYDIGFGASSDKGNVYVNIGYVNEKETLAGDREISAVPVFGAPIGFGGSSGTPRSRFMYYDNNGAFKNVQADGKGGLVPWTASSAFNFAPFNFLSTPQERTNMFVKADYALTDDVRVIMNGFYNNRKSAQALAPTPLFIGAAFGDTGYVLHANNPYNPTGLTLSTDTEDNQLYLIGRRMMEAGYRQFNQNVDQFQFSSGFEGNFDLGESTFYWDAGYTFADITNNEMTDGLLNMGNVKIAIGDVNTCNMTTGCVPLNLFGDSTAIGVGSITPEMLKYILFTAQDASNTNLKNYTANISGDVFELPAGMIGFASGYEKRWQKGFNLPDAFISAGLSSGNASQPTSGSYNVEEVYLELAVPLIADMAFVQSLDLELATRYSDYSNFGDTTNSKVGMKWRVNDDLMLRATYSESFRAPSISELFLGLSDAFPQVSDPCVGGAAANPTLPGCAGIPSNYDQPNPQIRTTVGGNEALTAEEGESITFGFVYNPSWIDGLSMTFDVFDVEVTGAVSSYGAQNILTTCATTGVTLCSLVKRNPSSGAVIDLVNRAVNLGGESTKGFDTNLSYRIETDFGVFLTRFDATYIDERSRKVTDLVTGTVTTIKDAGRAFDRDVVPRVRSNVSLDWSYNDFTASYLARFIKGTDEVCDFGRNAAQNAQEQLLCSMPSATVGGASFNHLGSMVYHDVSGSYQVSGNVRLTLGVNNLFESDPRVSRSTFANSFDPSMYEIPGRVVYGRVSLEF